MTEENDPSTQKVKKPSAVNNPTIPGDLFEVAGDLYTRFIDHHIAHALEPGKDGWSSAVEFLREPENREKTGQLLKLGADAAAPVLKGVPSPVLAAAALSLVDKLRGGK